MDDYFKLHYFVGGFIVKNGKRQLCTMDLIQPKCAELLRVCEILQDKLKRRSEFLIKNRALMEHVEKVYLFYIHHMYEISTVY